jgi:SulP family sulfate permease
MLHERRPGDQSTRWRLPSLPPGTQHIIQTQLGRTAARLRIAERRLWGQAHLLQQRMAAAPPSLKSKVPLIDWASRYDRSTFADDVLAALIVTLMLIPQSLAYALLAGLPGEVGLYASILPLVAYAVFGTSRALAVGPVAVVSLMTASAIAKLSGTLQVDPIVAAITLAFLSGLILLAMGVLRLGVVASFLSHPVISGFITASGILIATSQLKHLLGVKAGGDNLPSMLAGIAGQLGRINFPTVLIGVGATAFIFWSRRNLKGVLTARGFAPRSADIATKAAPVGAIIATTAATYLFGLQAMGVQIVGTIPSGVPPLTVPALNPDLVGQLLTSALLISVVGFVESVSVAQTLAARRRERVVPDQELLGLGAANVASALTGGYPVTGGFARSVVNADAGAATPAAGILTAFGILAAALLITPLLYYLPQATLAATIVVAVLSLVDLPSIGRIWRYSHSDFTAMIATIATTLLLGVEIGILTGVVVSIALHLWRTSQPHSAIVGIVPGTEHFRNIDRHRVVTSPRVLTLRVDESLYFPNARYLEDRIAALVAERPNLAHVVLMCPAVNHIDASALESLETINGYLKDAGIKFHLSEVKGPVMDRLRRSHLLDDLTGEVFLSQFDAAAALDPETFCSAAPTSPSGLRRTG